MHRLTLFAVVALLGAACGDSTSLKDDLVGIWVLEEGRSSLFRLGADGTYAIDYTGRLVSDPDNVGTFEVAGNTITYTVGEGSRLCDTGQVLVSEVELISPGELQGACRGRMHFHGWHSVQLDSGLSGELHRHQAATAASARRR